MFRILGEPSGKAERQILILRDVGIPKIPTTVRKFPYPARQDNAYQPLSLGDMSNGEPKIATGIIAFNTTNLIQICAGKDNMPYTLDDIFVYAPRFRERLSVSLTSE